MVNCERIASTKRPVSSRADSMDCIYLGQKVGELLVVDRSGSSLTLAYLVREASRIRHMVCSSTSFITCISQTSYRLAIRELYVT
jgi:hypothetical protein